MQLLKQNYNKFITANNFSYQPLFDAKLQQELVNLTATFRAQVRNSVAVINWLEKKKQTRYSVHTPDFNLFSLQNNKTDELSFRLVSSPEAFKIFSDTLRWKNYFMQHNSFVDLQNQVLKIRINFSKLAEWENELTVLLANLTIASFKESILQQTQKSTLLYTK